MIGQISQHLVLSVSSRTDCFRNLRFTGHLPAGHGTVFSRSPGRFFGTDSRNKFSMRLMSCCFLSALFRDCNCYKTVVVVSLKVFFCGWNSRIHLRGSESSCTPHYKATRVIGDGPRPLEPWSGRHLSWNPLLSHSTPNEELRASIYFMCISPSTRWVYRGTKPGTHETQARNL
ncbi:hypothetical protein TNCV_2281401 [Trichonephila clavipes]|nr:hypothetical protein TNCV_2281401 [Trichonephila clavipes]